MAWFRWWLRNAMFTWFVLTLIWGVASIVFDSLVLWLEGVDFTISWETQLTSIENRVIPAAAGFIVVGLAVHFWKVHRWDWLDSRQPIWAWVVGGLLGGLFVAYTWTQRGPTP